MLRGRLRRRTGGVPAIRAQATLALGFFTADLLNGTKVYVLAVIEHGSRRVRIPGAAEHPAQSWVVRHARNLLIDLDGGSAGAAVSCRTLIWNQRHLMMVLREYGGRSMVLLRAALR